MNDSVHQMSLLVGSLSGKLESLNESVKNLNEVWGQRESAATEGRRILHEKISTMQHDIQRVEAAVENMVRDIGQTIKPAIESYKSDRDRKDGAERQNKKFVGVLTLISGICGGGIEFLVHRMTGH